MKHLSRATAHDRGESWMRSKNLKLLEEIKQYAEDYYREHGKTPSHGTVASALGMGRSTVYYYLVEMAQRGIISTENIRKLMPDVTHAALVGSIPCGEPNEQEAMVEEYIPLPISVFGSGDFYVLRASGDSMIDAQINSGDLVVIERTNTADVGDIVVALTDERLNTLKRLYFDKDRDCYYLHPENPNYEDIYVSTLSIQGVARNIIKAL